MNEPKNLIVVDSLEKLQQLNSAKRKDEFQALNIDDIINNPSVLDELEYREVFFYLDVTIQKKKNMDEIVMMLQVRQYYILDIQRYFDIDSLLEFPAMVTYGSIKSVAAKKQVDSLFNNEVNQIVKFKLFKNRIATTQAINRLSINRAMPVVLGIIAAAEKKILDFSKEDYSRIGVEYSYEDAKDIDKLTKLAKVSLIKVFHKSKFKDEHRGMVEIILSTLQNPQTKHIVKDIKRKTEEVKPFAPLVTSRLQRNCFYLFGLDPMQTISICEELCNGIVIDGVKTKLITSPFTDSHNIADEAVEEIIKSLIDKFGIEYTLMNKRKFTDDENSTKEAIRPLHFSNKYFPKNLEGKLPKLHLEVYKFIFYRTLATQMKNSIYDVSKLIIEADDIELTANANKLEFKGWEKLDGYRQKTSESDTDYREQNISFPKNLFIGEVLTPIQVSDFKATDKNPPRYGKGRLISYLVDTKLCSAEEAPAVIDSLEKTGLTTEIQHMIHPTELGMLVDGIFTKYGELFKEEDKLRDYNNNIAMIKDEELEIDEVVEEYKSLVQDFEAVIGYEKKEDKPDDWMVEKAKNIAKFNGAILSEDNPMFLSRSLILAYINAKDNDFKKVGKCPECKKEQVIEDDISFRCFSKDCKFRLFKQGKDGAKGGIEGFFTNFGKNILKDDYAVLLGTLLKSNGKIYFSDLVSKKNTTFGAYVVLKKNTDYNNWQLSLSFPKSKNATIKDELKIENIL